VVALLTGARKMLAVPATRRPSPSHSSCSARSWADPAAFQTGSSIGSYFTAAWHFTACSDIATFSNYIAGSSPSATLTCGWRSRRRQVQKRRRGLRISATWRQCWPVLYRQDLPGLVKIAARCQRRSHFWFSPTKWALMTEKC
jgi:hypothetical protein